MCRPTLLTKRVRWELETPARELGYPSGEVAIYAVSVPSTVTEIFAAAGTSRSGFERRGVPPSAPTPRTARATRTYVVALTDQLDSDGLLTERAHQWQLVEVWPVG